MSKEPEIAAEAGMEADTMIDELGDLLEKYEIPIGLTNKLMLLSEYQSLEFIIDDSGSMRLDTDTIDPITRKPMSRWAEAQVRLKAMIEIIAYVPFEQIGIEFLNRKDRISLTRNGQTPQQFMATAYGQIDAIFARKPQGSTPALEKIQESLLRGQGSNIARYFFGDGKPNGGSVAIQEIIQILKARNNPAENPVTFLSCTNDDDAVEWMKDAEEVTLSSLSSSSSSSSCVYPVFWLLLHRARISLLTGFCFVFLVHFFQWSICIAVTTNGRIQHTTKIINFPHPQVAPYCSEADDFADEAREVLKDQGVALPYSKGFHLICELVAAMNPDDLDALDESVPFTKFTLDNLLGIVSNDASYQHYFDKFLEAQARRPVEHDERTGQPKQIDLLRKNTQWNYGDFRNASGAAKVIPHVRQFKQQIATML